MNKNRYERKIKTDMMEKLEKIDKTEKWRDYCNVILFGMVLVGFLIIGLLSPDKEISDTERRLLHSFPELNMHTIFADRGQDSFMDGFEEYAVDQFPYREAFRTVHSVFSLYGIGRKEINNIYYAEGHILKTSMSIHPDSVSRSLDRMQYIKKRYLQDNQVFFAMIPDKNYYLEKQTEVPYLDYEKLENLFREQTDEYAEFIDLRAELSLNDYYKTDTHWRQEKLKPVAEKIMLAMDNQFDFQFREEFVTDRFKGVYYGQGSLPVKQDTLSYLTADYMEDCVVTCYDSGKSEFFSLYDFTKTEGMDPYEIFLSGSRALMTIENSSAATDKELIMFRDSFGSSIAPLFAGCYKKITLIDIRYISPSILDRFVNFENADVLFLYSAQVLNNSEGQFLD
ncbi:MAG: hypothetical protein ACI4DK_02985 [Lachnospiraceae bacterium]